MIKNNRAVFLDRDGTLIASEVHDGIPIANNDPTEVVFLEGVREACRELRAAGFLLILVTNQPDVARGLVPRKSVDLVNAAVVEYLGLTAAWTCFHDDKDNCNCRKPKPGLILESALSYQIHLDLTSAIVGDRWRDVGAGKTAGISTVFVDQCYGETQLFKPDLTVSALIDAVPWLIAQGDENGSSKSI